MVAVNVPETESLNVQEVRTKLRAGFLRAVNDLNGESCSVLTYEKSVLHAKFSGWKPDGSEILVSDLETPSKVQIQSALLRAPDLLSLSFDRNVQLP